MEIFKVGDVVFVRGYKFEEVHTITSVMEHGYTTKYTANYEGRPIEMTVSSVPFKFAYKHFLCPPRDSDSD